MLYVKGEGNMSNISQKHLSISIFFFRDYRIRSIIYYYLVLLQLPITEFTIKCRSKNRIQGIFATAYKRVIILN